MGRQAYTLTEILVAVTIIIILIVVAILFYINTFKAGRDTQRKSDLSNVQTALEKYKTDFGEYPQSLADLVTDGYLPSIPKDPRDGEAVLGITDAIYRYMYRPSPDGATYSLYTYLEGDEDTGPQLYVVGPGGAVEGGYLAYTLDSGTLQGPAPGLASGSYTGVALVWGTITGSSFDGSYHIDIEGTELNGSVSGIGTDLPDGPGSGRCSYRGTIDSSQQFSGSFSNCQIYGGPLDSNGEPPGPILATNTPPVFAQITSGHGGGSQPTASPILPSITNPSASPVPSLPQKATPFGTQAPTAAPSAIPTAIPSLAPTTVPLSSPAPSTASPVPTLTQTPPHGCSSFAINTSVSEGGVTMLGGDLNGAGFAAIINKPEILKGKTIVEKNNGTLLIGADAIHNSDRDVVLISLNPSATGLIEWEHTYTALGPSCQKLFDYINDIERIPYEDSFVMVGTSDGGYEDISIETNIGFIQEIAQDGTIGQWGDGFNSDVNVSHPNVPYDLAEVIIPFDDINIGYLAAGTTSRRSANYKWYQENTTFFQLKRDPTPSEYMSFNRYYYDWGFSHPDLNYTGSLETGDAITGSSDFAYSIAESPNRTHPHYNTYIAGATNVGGTYDFFVVTKDSQNYRSSQMRLGGSGDDKAYAVVTSASGDSIYVGGESDSYTEGMRNMYLAKLSSTLGNVIWSLNIGAPYKEDIIYDMVIMDDGNLLIAASSETLSGDSDILLIKMDGNGSIIWARSIGDERDQTVSELINLQHSQGYALIGTHDNQDIFVAKVTEAGLIPGYSGVTSAAAIAGHIYPRLGEQFHSQYYDEYNFLNTIGDISGTYNSSSGIRYSESLNERVIERYGD